jgi:deoxyribodipyrimidine photo-lyase
MLKAFRESLFIFRRDLRLVDNTALNAALAQSDKVIPCFIFDPRQIKNNDYFTAPGFQFMLESLQEISEALEKKGAKLYIFEGAAEDIVGKIALERKIGAVFFNRDYTPFSRERDDAISQVCRESGVSTHIFGDCLLNEPEDSCKDDGSPYTVFTAFFKKNSQKKIRDMAITEEGSFLNDKLEIESPELFKSLLKKYSGPAIYSGGRKAALGILSEFETLRGYSKERDFPVLDATTHLSPHNKFGTVSIREVFHAASEYLGSTHAIIRQLYWRDFFTHIGYFFPHVFKGAFHKKFDRIQWENSTVKFEAWASGRTGFPIVDAAMAELNKTGFMHNRCRMITASFLVKDLHIDWRWGEKYFATKLVDYDPAVNNGSWQWAASTGCDAQPYFRIFNPWLQQEKFDNECIYIKKWLPELKYVEPKVLNGLFKSKEKIPGYPEQIVNHAEAASHAKEMYEDIY